MDEPAITAEQRLTFQKFYRRRIAEARVRDDREELAAARDILQAVVNDGLTPTTDGGASYVRRGARDWSDPATVQAARSASDEGGRRGKTKSTGPSRSKELVQGLLMLVGVLVLAGWLGWGYLFGGATEGADSSVEAGQTTTLVDPTGTENASGPTPTPIPTLEAALLADIVDAGGVKTGLVTPRTLEIRGVSFIVQPVRVAAGDWPLPDDARAASWVYGTVVNYVFGLAATPDNKQLLAALRPGDMLLLRMSAGGPAFRFAFVDAVRVAPQSSEVFAQNRPGLTLALVGDTEQAGRIIIRAVYLPGRSETGAGQATTVAALAERVSLREDELWLTCLDSRPLVRPDTPPGYVHLLVDYVIDNRLDEPLDTGRFVHAVEVGDLRYPAGESVAVEGLGSYPPLPDRLEPGRTISATAVYAIPQASLQAERLWRFSLDPAGQQAARFVLPPYPGSLTPAVNVERVGLDRSGRLSVTFAVQAPELAGIEVEAGGISLEGGEVAPGGDSFPWRLAAGERAEFSLLVRPRTQPVRLGLLERGFEISW